MWTMCQLAANAIDKRLVIKKPIARSQASNAPAKTIGTSTRTRELRRALIGWLVAAAAAHAANRWCPQPYKSSLWIVMKTIQGWGINRQLTLADGTPSFPRWLTRIRLSLQEKKRAQKRIQRKQQERKSLLHLDVIWGHKVAANGGALAAKWLSGIPLLRDLASCNETKHHESQLSCSSCPDPTLAGSKPLHPFLNLPKDILSHSLPVLEADKPW